MSHNSFPDFPPMMKTAVLFNQNVFGILHQDLKIANLPQQSILDELLQLYFSRVAFIKSIIHPEKFRLDFNNYYEYRVPDVPMPPHVKCMLANPISPALLLSMLALAAPHHPLYQDKEKTRQTFYEPAKKLFLMDAENMNLTQLKTGIHLSLYAVMNQLWNHAFYFHGVNVTMCRFLKLAEFDKTPKRISGNPVDQNITSEESRRCFWYVRESDVSGSAASKRHHFFESEDEFKDLLLPIPESMFYFSHPSNYLPTVSLKQFLDPQMPTEWSQSLSCNAYLMVLESIYARITSFRRKAESLNMKIIDVGSGGVLMQDYQQLRTDLALFYYRLPEFVKLFDRGAFPPTWTPDCSEWTILTIIYHSTYASLHGIEI